MIFLCTYVLSIYCNIVVIVSKNKYFFFVFVEGILKNLASFLCVYTHA